MTPAGYSGKPLLAKLGYEPGESVLTVNPPAWFAAALKKKHVGLRKQLPATWVHGFFSSQTELEEFLETTNLNDIEKGLWVSWPKKSSSLSTDLTEHTFRDKILPLGWVDIKVAAIDETWSGLKFTRRTTPK